MSVSAIVALLSAIAGAWAAFQKWQDARERALIDRVDTVADQAADDAEKAATPEDFAKAAAEIEEAEHES